jgi:hypothetical protein
MRFEYRSSDETVAEDREWRIVLKAVLRRSGAGHFRLFRLSFEYPRREPRADSWLYKQLSVSTAWRFYGRRSELGSKILWLPGLRLAD